MKEVPYPNHHFTFLVRYLKFLGGTLKNGKLWRTHQVVTISITVPGTVEQKVFLCHENKSHQGVQGVLMWHDLTCCFILFGLVHNNPIWTFNFHHGTILGKHSNHFRTSRTSKSWRYPSPRNSHQQDYYIFGKIILGIHNHQDDMNETSQKTGIMVPKKTCISDRQDCILPSPAGRGTKGNSSSNPTDGRNPKQTPRMYKTRLE